MNVGEDFKVHNFGSYTTRLLEIVREFISIYIKLNEKNFHFHFFFHSNLPYLKFAEQYIIFCRKFNTTIINRKNKSLKSLIKIFIDQKFNTY